MDLEIKSYGKINFTLDIKNRRKDGYHNIESIIQTIDIYDTLRFKKIEKGIEIISNHQYLPIDRRNLIYKAYKQLTLYTEKEFGIRIEIDKHIPISAGLGGGSSNAAATLIALNELYELDLSKEELTEVAENIGMDVVFFVYGGLKYVYGRGERISNLGEFPFDVWIIIVKPSVSISTVWAYNRFDIAKPHKKRAYTKCALKALSEKDYKRFFGCLGNDFVHLLIESYPEITRLKRKLENYGIRYINISGSGPTIFGIVESKEIGEKIVKNFKEEGHFAQIVRPISHPYSIIRRVPVVYEDSYRVRV